MYINEAAKLSGTTKKAIEYYCQKGLLDPAMRKLSPAYDEYVLKLQKADQAFSQRYQQ